MERRTSGPGSSPGPDLRLLVTGRVTSQLGDQLQSLALPLTVVALTGSTAQAGLVLGLQTAATLLLGMVAGALVDRWDRKRVMIGVELARAALVTAVVVAMLTGVLAVPQLCGFALLNGALGTLFSAANVSALPSLVPPARLPEALGLLSTIGNALRVAGAPLAGLVYGLGSVVPFAANAVSFLVSAGTLSAIRTPFNAERRRTRVHVRDVATDLVEGLAWLRGRPAIRTLALLDAADAFRFGAGYLLIIVLAERLHATPFEIGLVFAGAGIGGLLGSVLAARVARRLPVGSLSVAMLWLEAGTFPGYALAPTWWLLPVVALAESVFSPIYTVALDSYRLTITPEPVRGRIAGIVDTLTVTGSTIGTVSSGALIALLGPTALVFALAALLGMLALIATLDRDIRTARLDAA